MKRRTYIGIVAGFVMAIIFGMKIYASSLETNNSFPNQSSSETYMRNDSLIFNRGNEVRSEHYTGKINISTVIIKPEYDIHHLIFEPGSYNSWHIHPDADQVLLILDGEGFYQEEGKPKRLIKRGDVIDTPANVKHWHGATPDSRLVHLSVTTKTGKSHIEWKDLMKSDEYNQ